jgi:hypothetical protein
MKAALLHLSLHFTSLFLVAQSDTRACTWSFTAQMNTPERESQLEMRSKSSYGLLYDNVLYYGYSGSATTHDRTFSASTVLSKQRSEKFDYRLKIGITLVNIHLYDRLDTGGFTLAFNGSKTRMDFSLAPGVSRSASWKKMMFYTGFELPFTLGGKTNLLSSYYSSSTNSTGTITDEKGETMASYLSIGVGSFSGIGFKLHHFFLGSEISFAFLFNKTTGLSTLRTHYDDTINNIHSNLEESFSPKVSEFDLSRVRGSLFISYSF